MQMSRRGMLEEGSGVGGKASKGSSATRNG
jgi:hypothetical protein